ncbi:MAG: hydantoinase B/oxoprolinase family protein [Acidobacteria bacterium]|nr:hydantoinase B/oxoprolinase family protein [Acidobacteriota bacterium]
MANKSDPILGEVIKSQLIATVADMGTTLSRNAVSPEITEERDYSNGVVLERGEVVVMDNLLHLGAVSETAANIQDMFQFAIKPGDVVFTNDPYSGGSHVQDFMAITPFFYERDSLGYLSCRAHFPDIGGQVPGGYFPFADDVWAEGSRITPVKIIREGKMAGDVVDAVVMNSRFADAFRLNLCSMLAALEIGKLRLEQMARKYGKENLRQGMLYCIRYSEAQLESEMQKWPEGEFIGESVLDHDARSSSELRLHVALKVKAGKAVLDFSASREQSAGFVNSTRANTVSCALVPVYVLLGGKLPINSGLLRNLEIRTREGTVVHPVFPAPVGWGPFHVGTEIVSAVTQAIVKMFPDRLASLAPKFLMVQAQWPEKGEVFPLHMFLQGGAGGTRGLEGWGTPGPFSRSRTPSVELVEMEKPIRVKQLELLPDSAGDGRWRGGFGTVAEFEFQDTTLINAVIEGRIHTAESVAQGENGGCNELSIRNEKVNGGVLWQHEVTSETVRIRMGGGAGWGSPSERDEGSIRSDLDNELRSRNPWKGPADPRS